MATSSIMPSPAAHTAALRGRAEAELQEFGDKQQRRPQMYKLFRNAAASLRNQEKIVGSKPAKSDSEVDAQRLIHELQVHQVELELQNVELQESRDRMEELLVKYTDLYDFAPVGYLTLNESGQILEANLTGAALLGTVRAQIINRRLVTSIASFSRSVFQAFLGHVFAGIKSQICEVQLLRADGTSFWVDFHGTAAISINSPQKWCRLVVSDITALKRAEEAQQRVAALALSNEELRREVVQRRVVEESLKKTEQHLNRLLSESRLIHLKMQQLSRRVVHSQEEERKRISRELHDVIAQTLTGINIRLATLKKEAGLSPKAFDRHLTRTQQMVEQSINTIHRFARELRPPVLDDLGLIPALHSHLKHFTAETGVRTHLKAYAGVEQLSPARRSALYRVAQEALTNVARHAQASRVEVSLQKLQDSVTLKITDDGKAFDVEKALLPKNGKRLGLLGMKERLEMVGGNFGIASVPGRGTTIAAQIPLVKARRGPQKKNAKTTRNRL